MKNVIALTTLIIIMLSCTENQTRLNSIGEKIRDFGATGIAMGLKCKNTATIKTDLESVLIKIDFLTTDKPEKKFEAVCELVIRTYVAPMVKEMTTADWQCELDPVDQGADVLVKHVCSRL